MRRDRGAGEANTVAVHVASVQHLAAHSSFLTGDRFTFQPWPARTGNSVPGHVIPDQNTRAAHAAGVTCRFAGKARERLDALIRRRRVATAAVFLHAIHPTAPPA